MALSKVFVPMPPPQWNMPGTMKRRANSGVDGPILRDDVFVVFEAHAGIELRVGPSEVHEQLAAALAESGEIGIGGVENLAGECEIFVVLVDVKLLHRLGVGEAGERRAGPEDEADEAAGVGVPGALAGGSVDVLANPGALAVGARDFGTDGPAGKEAFALAGYVAVDTLEGGDLIRGETIGVLAGAVATGKVVRGWKSQRSGFSMRPSLTPSLASHFS